jgi:hypothetical protein
MRRGPAIAASGNFPKAAIVVLAIVAGTALLVTAGVAPQPR